MSPSSTVHGGRGQQETTYFTVELLLHAAFVADEGWGYMLEPARTRPRELERKGGLTRAHMILLCQVPGPI